MAQHTPPAHDFDDEQHGVGHIVPIKFLVATCVALLVLTVLTVTAAMIDFREYGLAELNILVALAIAVVKGALVCLFFMHLRWDRPFHGFVIVASLAFVALFIGLAMTDTFEYGGDIDRYQQDVLKGQEVPKVQNKLDELATSPAEP